MQIIPLERRIKHALQSYGHVNANEVDVLCIGPDDFLIEGAYSLQRDPVQNIWHFSEMVMFDNKLIDLVPVSVSHDAMSAVIDGILLIAKRKFESLNADFLRDCGVKVR